MDTAPLSHCSDPTKVWGSRLAKAGSSPSLKIPHCSLAAERSPRGKRTTLRRAAEGISLDSGAVIFLRVREGEVLTLQIHPCALGQYRGIVRSLGGGEKRNPHLKKGTNPPPEGWELGEEVNKQQRSWE